MTQISAGPLGGALGLHEERATLGFHAPYGPFNSSIWSFTRWHATC